MAASGPMLQQWRRHPHHDKQLQRRRNLQARFRFDLGKNVVPLRLVELYPFEPATRCGSAQATAPLTTPKEVAWFLASYARDAKARIDSRATLPGLASRVKLLLEALLR